MRNEFDPDYRSGTWQTEELYEIDGDIVHFFTKDKISQLMGGFKLLRVEKIEEGDLPKRLYLVALRKPNSHS